MKLIQLKKNFLFLYRPYRNNYFLILLIFSIFIITSGSLFADNAELRKEAIELYYQKRYVEALDLFDDYLKKNPDDDEANVYYAECFSKNLETDLLIEKAKKLKEQMRYNDALDVLYEAKRISPYVVEIEVLIENIEDEKRKAKPFEHLSPDELNEYKKKYSLGIKMLEEGKNEVAMNLFARCLAIAPKSPEAIEGYNKANNLYKSQLHREKLYDIFQEADALKTQKKYVMAISKYEEVLRYDPSNVRARNEISTLNEIIQTEKEKSEKKREASLLFRSAKSYYDSRDYDKAIEQFTLGKEIDAEFTDWEGWIQKSRKAKEDYEKRIFEAKLREIESKYEGALFFLATEKYSEAIAEFDTVYRIAKKYNQKEMEKNALEFIKKIKDVLKQKEEEVVSSESPYYELVQTLTALGIKKYQQKKYSESKKYFENILELFPKNKIANKYFVLCNVQMQEGYSEKFLSNILPQIKKNIKTNTAEAKRLLDLAKSVNPDHPEVIRLDKQLKEQEGIIKKGKVPKATLDSWYASALNQSRSNPTQAKAQCHRILNADPNYIRARTLLARINAQNSNNFSQVSSDQIKPAAQRAYAQGMLHYNNGRIRQAMNHFNQAVQIDPKFYKARNALNKCKAYLNS